MSCPLSQLARQQGRENTKVVCTGMGQGLARITVGYLATGRRRYNPLRTTLWLPPPTSWRPFRTWLMFALSHTLGGTLLTSSNREYVSVRAKKWCRWYCFQCNGCQSEQLYCCHSCCVQGCVVVAVITGVSARFLIEKGTIGQGIKRCPDTGYFDWLRLIPMFLLSIEIWWREPLRRFRGGII